MREIDVHLRGVAECTLKAGRSCSVKTFSQDRESGSNAAINYENSDGGSPEVAGNEQSSVQKCITVEILKADKEQQTVTGIVLQPEVVDGQGDIMSADVIRDAAYDFLSTFNQKTKLGVQHSIFKAGQLALVESYIAPMEFALGTKTVKEGSWIMTTKVLDGKIWEKVKKGEITGFSIGGRAQVVSLSP